MYSLIIKIIYEWTGKVSKVHTVTHLLDHLLKDTICTKSFDGKLSDRIQ